MRVIVRLGGDPETTDQPGDQKPENDVAGQLTEAGMQAIFTYSVAQSSEKDIHEPCIAQV
jgi:hypothetical protein